MISLTRWSFTINNPKIDLKTFCDSLWENNDIKYLIVGLEHGQLQNVLHYQGFVIFTHGKSTKQVSEIIPNAHLEISKTGQTQNTSYCSKSGYYRIYSR